MSVVSKMDDELSAFPLWETIVRKELRSESAMLEDIEANRSVLVIDV